jgi:flagellar basal-body rod protein FlgB
MLQKTLDATWDRTSIIADNISNKDTPGYKAKKLEFENILRNKINKPEETLYALKLRARVFPQPKQSIESIVNSVKPVVHTDPSTQMRVDGNNVDEDHENLELVRAKLQYDFLARKITDEYNLLKYAISEGRG